MNMLPTKEGILYNPSKKTHWNVASYSRRSKYKNQEVYIGTPEGARRRSIKLAKARGKTFHGIYALKLGWFWYRERVGNTNDWETYYGMFPVTADNFRLVDMV